MRKILAGFMATSMIVAMASSVTFAATTPSAQLGVTEMDDMAGAVNGQTIIPAPAAGQSLRSGSWKLNENIKGIHVALADGFTFEVPINEVLQYTGTVSLTAGGSVNAYNAITGLGASEREAVVEALAGKDFSFTKDGIVYSGKTVKKNASAITLKFDRPGNIALSTATFSLDVSYSAELPVTELIDASSTVIARYTDSFAPGALAAQLPAANYVKVTASNLVDGSATAIPDVDTNGTFKDTNCSVNDVVYCDNEGNPMVLTEKKGNVDEDQNADDGVQGGKTLYFLLRNDVVPKLDDDSFWKLKITKGDNGKYVKAATDVNKNFSSGLYSLQSGAIFEPSKGRNRYIKVELNDIYTDDEYKLTLDMRISAKSKAVDSKLKIKGQLVTDDSEIKIKDFYFYMKNLVKDADNDWKVGINGLMLNPLTNDWNDVTWFDEDGDVAHMKFFADSDVSKFYSKLSTKWDHTDYASYFNDQDAFIFDFVGSPKLSATSRADLEIYNPFLDEDGNTTIDPSSAVIYQVIDGDLFDVTDSFEYKEGENGDMAYVTRTRFLGTYIICEKAVEEAVGDSSDVPEDLIPEETNPSEVTPDNNNGGKAPANTGKYL